MRLREFLSRLGDGHTGIGGPRAASEERPATAPIRFGVTTDGLYISASDVSDLADARGARLVSYGGVDVAALVDRLKRHSAIENDEHAWGKLRWWMVDSARCANLLERECASAPVPMVLRMPSGRSKTASVAFTTKPERETRAWTLPPVRYDLLARDDDPFLFTMLEPSKTAYFRVATVMGREAYEFASRYGWGDVKSMLGYYYQQRKRPMPADIDDALAGVPSFYEHAHLLLEAMKKNQVPNLVIDLRGNDGGMTPSLVPFLYELYGDAYFGHAFKGQFVTRISSLYLEKMKKTLDEIRREDGDPSLELGGYAFPKPERGTAVEKRTKKVAEYAEKGFSFAPRVQALNGEPYYRPKRIIVLSDPGTYSAAFHFLAYLKEMGAEIVGVPPGQSPNTFMEVTPFTLTRSRLSGSISNSEQVFLPETPTASAYPVDHPLTWDVARTFKFDDDAAVRYALAVLAKKF
jgi:hypothetical protein